MLWFDVHLHEERFVEIAGNEHGPRHSGDEDALYLRDLTVDRPAIDTFARGHLTLLCMRVQNGRTSECGCYFFSRMTIVVTVFTPFRSLRVSG